MGYLAGSLRGEVAWCGHVYGRKVPLYYSNLHSILLALLSRQSLMPTMP